MGHILKSGEPYRIGVVPEEELAVAWICQWCASLRGTTLFIDEIDYWYPSSLHIPCQGILDIARYGRHYDQTLVAVARRPSAVHPSYRAQGTLWVFPMRERGDCAYVRDVTGGFDPKSLKVLESEGEHRLVSQVARLDPNGVVLHKFDLRNGDLNPVETNKE